MKAHNAGRFAQVNTRTVTYIELDGTEHVDLQGSPVLRRPIVTTDAPMDIQFDRQWWGFNVADLPSFPPKNGELIVELIEGGGEKVFEVIPELDGRPPFEYVNADRDRVLIHTQHIERV